MNRNLGLLRASGRTAMAIGFALLVAALVLIGTRQSPWVAAQGIFQGAFGSSITTLSTLALATPLIFSALSFAFGFRAGIFNAGGQGQFEMGAFLAAWAGFSPWFSAWPGYAHVPLVILAGAVGGALWSLPPILWKIYAGMNEILTTLMMSYVASLLNQYLVLNVFRAANLQPGANAQTSPLVHAAQFPVLFPQSQVTLMLPLALGMAIGLWVFYRWSILGYEFTMVGKGEALAESSGLPVKRLKIMAMLGSGALAGLAGATVVGGVFMADVTPIGGSVGFNGILAALLAGNTPIGIPLTAMFFGAIQNGGLGLQIFTPVSRYISDVVMAAIIIFASARTLPRVRWWPSRLVRASRAAKPTEGRDV